MTAVPSRLRPSAGVESIKGKGTTFTVKLPLELAGPIERKAPVEPPVQVNLTDLHILMAEDVQAALAAGMNAHLAKPIVIDTVSRVIVENIEQEERNQ